MPEQVTHQAAQDWRWVQTPDPSNMIFALKVKTEKIRLDNKPHREIIASPGILYQLPTQFRNLNAVFLNPSLNSIGVGDWYFIGENLGPQESEFYFFNNTVPGSPAVPYNVAEGMEERSWDRVITDIIARADKHYPESTGGISKGVRGTITRDRWTVSLYGVPAMTVPTKIVRRKYLSALKFKVPRYPVPITKMLDFTIGSETRVVDSSLHDSIDLPEASASRDSSFTGVSNGGGGRVPGYKAERTNFTKWAPYFVPGMPVQNEQGLWELVIEQRTPPPMPRSTKL